MALPSLFISRQSRFGPSDSVLWSRTQTLLVFLLYFLLSTIWLYAWPSRQGVCLCERGTLFFFLHIHIVFDSFDSNFQCSCAIFFYLYVICILLVFFFKLTENSTCCSLAFIQQSFKLHTTTGLLFALQVHRLQM